MPCSTTATIKNKSNRMTTNKYFSSSSTENTDLRQILQTLLYGQKQSWGKFQYMYWEADIEWDHFIATVIIERASPNDVINAIDWNKRMMEQDCSTQSSVERTIERTINLFYGTCFGARLTL